MPVCQGGEVRIKIGPVISVIALTKIHLEEDAGKSIHGSDNTSLIDYNRAGTALIEIVTEPVMRNAEEAYAFLYEIRRLVRYLEVGDANMEEGSLRCDANISIRPKGSSELGKKVEIKNMNSLNNVKKAINHEIKRQEEIIKTERNVLSETRSFNPQTGNSTGMREKETLTDYRYFPEPDLSPVLLTDDWIETLEKDLPELPMDKELRYVREFSLTDYDASLLSRSKHTAIYFESVVNSCKNPKAAANWMMGPITTAMKASNGSIVDIAIDPKQIARIIEDIEKEKYSYSYASKSIFPLLLKSPELEIEQLIKGNKDSGNNLEEIVKMVLNEFPKEVELYKLGNKKILGMLMGQVMRKSGGTADPKKAKEQLQSTLNIT
jgi:aspartyl-tRNA(Asn)/glutamyl-tRNA(Gln) amidotransferase subunit B